MNNSKKISVNYSSLVGLKAELVRKQAEVEDARTKIDHTKTSLPKPHVKKRKSKIKVEKADKKEEIYLEDVATLKKSKYMLEAKSRLYEKLKKHGDKDQNYLVDFSNKSESEDEIYHEDDYDDVNSDPEEDWVNYTDCFGRTRKCLRKDLPKMKEKDATIKRDVINESEIKNNEIQNEKKDKQTFIPPPKEPDIEIMRKKWEEQTEKLSHKPDIHYQDVLFDEARSHGVGYYAFSQDDDERLKQQENLDKLRKETEQKQKELMEIKELKNKMEDNRLKAARRRQRIRAGLPAEPDEEEEALKPQETLAESNSLKQPENSTPLLGDNSKNPAQSMDENSLFEVEDKIKAFGELLGKRPKFRELSQEEWIHKRRKDRLNEFAPVYDNFISGGNLKATRNNQIVKRDCDVDDPLRINTEGPEPTDLWECQGEENPNNEQDSDFVGPVPPPPSFNYSLPPPGLIPNPALDLVKSGLIPPIEILRSVPPPFINCPLNSTNLNNTVPTLLTKPQNKTIDQAESESDSDDSEIIGPMPPPPDVQQSISNIPLPTLPSPDNDKQSLNVDKISEGLKFLRKKYD